MPAAVAPWLEDLDDEWTIPAFPPPAASQPALIFGEQQAISLRSDKSRIPRRSSGAFSAQNGHDDHSSVGQSSQHGRPALQTISHNAAPGSRDVSKQSTVTSNASAGSVVRYDTMERTAPSSSPDKTKVTLEWKRRLVQGDVGYGDQTDLFGPSALENIFSPAKQSPSPDKAAASGRMRFRKQDAMPSSPPPWPSSVDFTIPDHEDVFAPASKSLQGDDSLQEFSHTDEDTMWRGVDDADSLHEHSPDRDASTCPIGESHLQPRASIEHGQQRAKRIFTGLTQLSNEGFSPVFISKHTTLNGQVDYAPVDSLLAKQMQARPLDPVRAAAASATTGMDARDFGQGDTISITHPCTDMIDHTQPSIPEVSLPENLPTGTPPITALGTFVTTKRGGLSAYGSFKTRALSPSQPETIPDLSTIRQSSPDVTEEHHQTSPYSCVSQARRPLPMPPHIPTTPVAAEGSQLLSPPKTRSSASPLKLFGAYDTFTNGRLLRRMSQLEDPDSAGISNSPPMGATYLSRIEQSHAEQDETNVPTGGRPELLRNLSYSQTASKLSTFGEGDLDERDFSADFSFGTEEDLGARDDRNESSPPPDAMPPGSRTPFRFHLETSADFGSLPQHSSNPKRKLSQRSIVKSAATNDPRTLSLRKSRGPVDGNAVHPADPQPDYAAEGKRPRSSPSKAPTPKRRRTLHAMELEGEQKAQSLDSHVDVQRQQHDKSPSLSGYGYQQAACSYRTSQCGSIRPRNPTPSQRRREELQAEIDEATVAFMSSSPRLEAIKEHIEASDIPGLFNLADQAKAVASEVAAFTLNIRKSSADGERKKSITTQDFLDEAMHIMALIRARGRPNSGLGSVEESDAEEALEYHLRPDDVERSPSPLRVSRPPSREGPLNGWRPRSQQQRDPRVVSQLRRFEESDNIDLVDATFQSLRLKDEDDQQHQPDAAESPVNIRISGPHSEAQRDRADSGASEAKQGDSFKTNLSAEYSSGRTAGTNSTRKSDNVATLAPETVAHLIPDEVAGMTFDREKGRWVRLRSPERKKLEHHAVSYLSSNVGSDDDPLGNIPDLTIDEVKELHRVRGSTLFGQREVLQQSTRDFVTQQFYKEERQSVAFEHIPRNPLNSSSVPSRYTAFASSGQQVETRATSWSNEELACMARAGQSTHSPFKHAVQSKAFDLHFDESRISVLERDHQRPTGASSFAEDQLADEILALDESDVEELPAVPHHRVPKSAIPTYRGAARSLSLRKKTLDRAMHANGPDQSELSIFAELPDKRVMSVSVSVSRPPAFSTPSDELLLKPSSPARAENTFYLSDLPDFTVHETDEHHPSEQALAKRVAQHAVEMAGDRFAMSVQTMVKILTDVQPEEPFWEDVNHLNLSGKDLESLHGLDEFCVRVQELNVSNNHIAQLVGAPTSLRALNARSNALSSLTAWGHLMNLQYLDISSNDIDSLEGLAGLVHLREIKADDNRIVSLDGVMELDGLLKLSVKRNHLSSVDFGHSQSKRLEVLDMSSNELNVVSNLEGLPSLTRLVLDDNALETLGSEDTTAEPCIKLTSLSACHNKITSLTLICFLNLQYLNVDDNRLRDLQGLDQLSRLDVLSMRNQTISAPSTINTILAHKLNIRALYLSSNNLQTLALPHHYHSIHHLELASCALATLPPDFGLRFPNLRTMNLNFNALKDLRPLLNIPHLEALHAAGNRISRLRQTVAALSRFAALRVLDLRQNPVALGFYAPLAPTVAQTQMVRSVTASSALDLDDSNDGAMQQRVAANAHLLPAAHKGGNAEFYSRLDEDTRLRRRVYELLLANSCRALGTLDGLPFDGARVNVRDAVWERLRELGVLVKSARA